MEEIRQVAKSDAESSEQTLNMADVDIMKQHMNMDSFTDVNLLDVEIEEETESYGGDREIIKCGSSTDPNALAYYIGREFEEKADCVVIQTIGPKALSKAILAIVQLKSIVAPYIDGYTLVCRFSVRKLMLPGEEERTAIRTRLFPVPDRYVV